MRNVIVLLVGLCLLAAPAVAQFQQVVEIRVRGGHEVQFEDFIKKLKEAADKTGAQQSWAAFQVTVGKAGPLYRIALPFEKWSERDQWGNPRGMLVEAFGAEEGTKLYTEGTSAVMRTTVRIWGMVGDTPAPAVGNLAPHYDVWIREVKRDMVGEYEGLLRRFKSAYASMDENPNVTRWRLLYGEGNGNTFRRTQPIANFAQNDTFNGRAVIEKQFGPDAPLLFERLGNMVVKSDRFVSTHRPDLSRTAGSASSN